MSTYQINPGLRQPPVSQTDSAISTICFLLGAPHLYAFLKHRQNSRRPNHPTRYVMAALLVAVIASLVELSLA